MSSSRPVSVQTEILNAAGTTLYTLPVNSSELVAEVDVLAVVNQAGVARTVDIHRIPLGGSASVENLVVGKDTAVAANGTFNYSGPPIVLDTPGDFLLAIASAADALNVNMKITETNLAGVGGV